MSTSIVYHAWGAIGYALAKTEYVRGQMIFHLEKRREVQRCSRCGSQAVTQAGRVDRLVRGVSVGLRPVFLALRLHRLHCKDCDAIALEDAEVADARKSYTKRVAEYALTLCRFCTISHAAFLVGLAWGTVKEILKSDLAHRARKINWRGLTHIAIDEISYGSGQNKYLTVVMDLVEQRVIYVHEGRDKQALAPFFKTLRRNRTRLQAVAMDMHEPYRLAVEEFYKHPCDVVYDRFHVIKLLNEHIDEIRREEMGKAEGPHGKRYLKGVRYLLLRGNENLREDARERLQEALKVNETLSTTYILKEDLRAILRLETLKKANAALQDWVARADASGVSRLRRFANTLRNHWAGILAFWKHKITTGPLEGLNNAIKVMKRKAYGFRDIAFFKLRILFVHECKRMVAGV